MEELAGFFIILFVGMVFVCCGGSSDIAMKTASKVIEKKNQAVGKIPGSDNVGISAVFWMILFGGFILWVYGEYKRAGG